MSAGCMLLAGRPGWGILICTSPAAGGGPAAPSPLPLAQLHGLSSTVVGPPALLLMPVKEASQLLFAIVNLRLGALLALAPSGSDPGRPDSLILPGAAAEGGLK